MAQQIDSIVFDLGGVLIDWNPKYVYRDYFDSSDDLDYFFDNVCTSQWNEEQDAGKPLHIATQERITAYPEWEQAIRDFYGRWEEMLGGPIIGTVELFKKLKKTGKYKFYALTNWSAETFPVALARYDFLHWFDGRLVSGEENMAKPNPEIFSRLIDRFNLNSEKTVFIDDNLRNLKAAEPYFASCIAFTSPEELEIDLNKLLI